MFPYELVQELKKAGYPVNPPDVPDLSELIEACGQGGSYFTGLQHIVDSPASYLNGLWRATGFNNDKDLYEEATAITPITAVANLWLALNKK